MSRAHVSRLLSVVAFLGVALAAPVVHAQPVPLSTCNGAWTAWPSSSPETIWRRSTTFTSLDLSTAQVDAGLNDAFAEWGQPGCSSFDAAAGSTTIASPLDNQDNDDTIGFVGSGWPFGQSALAVTTPAWFGDCEIFQADMVFNQRDWEWVVGSPANWWEADFEAVAVHEIGHWIGFDHNGWPGSSLNPSYSGDTSERTLTCSDTEGVCAAYPSGGTACLGDEYCPCSESCVGGACTGGGDDDDDDDDDDDGAPGGICGSGVLQQYTEQEPNDWTNDDDVNYLEASGADMRLAGFLTCGNNGEQYTGDIDWIVIDFPCTGTARFTMDWSANALMDFYVLGTDPEEPLASVLSEQVSPPTVDTAAAGGRLFVALACWDGEPGSWSFEIDWEPFGGGDDDDATADDDDATTDDDDGADDDDDDGAPVGRVRTNACGCHSSADPGAAALLAVLLTLVVATRRTAWY